MDCTICLQTIHDKECYKIYCGHTFHKICIDEWNKTSNTCPLCRKMYSAKNTIEFFKWFDEKMNIMVGKMNEEMTNVELTNVICDVIEINDVFFDCVDDGLKFGKEFIHQLMDFTVSFKLYFHDIAWYNNTIKKYKKILSRRATENKYGCIIS